MNAYEVEKTVFFSDDQWKSLLMIMYAPDEFIAKYLIKNNAIKEKRRFLAVSKG